MTPHQFSKMHVDNSFKRVLSAKDAAYIHFHYCFEMALYCELVVMGLIEGDENANPDCFLRELEAMKS